MYSSSAGTEIFGYWNPFVTKFDSQSFYNFEEDNQPLYDLEERTHYLWEKTGYATSSLYGMPLVVSATTSLSNRNQFTSIQDAIDSLPDVIRTPTLIEVAVSGDLGGINLQNIEIKGDGMLEIINRGYAKIYSGLADLNTDQDMEVDYHLVSSIGKGHGTYSEYTMMGAINQLSSLDLSSTIHNTSALSISQNVSSLWDQDDCHRTFVQYANLSKVDGQRNDRLSVGFIQGFTNANLGFRTAGTPLYNIPTFERVGYHLAYNIEDASIPVLDVSAFRGDTGIFFNRNGSINSYGTKKPIVGGTYCNTLSSINIENCNGPMYIRGFCVDSASGGDLDWEGTPYRASGAGISVKNSNPTIENCSVMRAATYGAEFINSDVTLSRGFFAYRNYLPTGATRDGRKTAGIRAVNSNVTLQVDSNYASGVDFTFNTQCHTYGALLENSTLKGGQSRPQTNGFDATMSFAYNEVGIKADNSIIDLSGNLDIYNNNKGMVLNSSKVSCDRLTVDCNNDEGILATNSDIIYGNNYVRNLYMNDVSGSRSAQTLFNRNGQHLVLNNSTFSYDTEVSATILGTKFGGLRFNDSHGVANPHVNTDIRQALPSIHLNNSDFVGIHTRVNVSGGAFNQAGLKGAAIHATNSSNATLLGTNQGASMLIGPPNLTSIYAAGAYADKSSKLSFRGPTVIAQFGYGAVADNNSTLEFCPHKKNDFAVDPSGFALNASANHTSVEIHTNYHTCIAANNNSQIILEDLGSPVLIASETSPDYSPDSRFVSAGSMQFFPNSANTDYIGAYAGNRSDLSVLIPDAGETSDKMSEGTIGGPALGYNYYLIDPWVTDASAVIRDTISNGGMCVQAVGDSVVNVNNVHFLMGHLNADGTYLDPSATAAGCNQLRIWNIADNSKLFASHIAVSGSDPSQLWDSRGVAHYHGPRATYLSGTDVEGGTGSIYDDSGGAQGVVTAGASVAYGARPDTPDTSALSVLDTFGLGVGVHPDQYKNSLEGTGQISSELSSLNAIRAGAGVNAAMGGASGDSIFGCLAPSNIGPFRLYFSPKSEARFLSYVSGTTPAAWPAGKFRYALFANDTRPLQHLAQGYSLSGGAGVHPNKEDVSAVTTALFTQDYASGTVDLSGHYHPSALLVSDRGSQVYLDESASNLFANAKHCAAKPASGRANPKVSIFRSKTSTGGEGYAGTGATDAIGSGLRSLSIFDIRRKV